MSRRSDANTVFISMAFIGLGIALSHHWLTDATDFVKGKVSSKGTDKPAISTVGGNGGSGFDPGIGSGQGAGGGGGGSW